MKQRRIKMYSLDFLMFAYEKRVEEEEMIEDGRMEAWERCSMYELRESYDESIYMFE